MDNKIATPKNELLEKLDEAIRESAKKTVAAALEPVEQEALKRAAESICNVTGAHFKGRISESLEKCFTDLRRQAADIVYSRLVEQAVKSLTEHPHIHFPS